LFKGKSKLHIS